MSNLKACRRLSVVIRGGFRSTEGRRLFNLGYVGRKTSQECGLGLAGLRCLHSPCQRRTSISSDSGRHLGLHGQNGSRGRPMS